MKKFKQLARIKEVYANGGNIIKYLKSIDQQDKNTTEDILISYDFQSGSYLRKFSDHPEIKDLYCGALAKIIEELDGYSSLMEVGVGEGTTLGNLLKKLKHRPKTTLGFDISWSRLKFAKAFLNDIGFNDVSLFTANLFEIPLQDNSVDIVYTAHSLEPNGGKEKEALQELYRVASKYLILLEPAYELADEEKRQRMRDHGYVTNLYSTAIDLGYKVIEHRLFDHCTNPNNPTGLILIEKKSSEKNHPELRCPLTLKALEKENESLMYCKESFLAYPIMGGIPCLLKENSILAAHLHTDYEKFKQEEKIEYKFDVISAKD